MTDAGSRSTAPAPCLPIVGIGAAAGGLEAIAELIAGLPPDCGMAFLLVQHLDPAHESLLGEILTRKTSLTVREAAAGMTIECNHLYVLPPNAVMTVQQGRLELRRRGETAGAVMPVDSLLLSLARDQGARAIGVILSGQGQDGARGLEAVKQEGGLTFVQDDASARFNGMPRAAAAHSAIDFTLPPREIAAELLRVARHPYVAGGDSAALAPSPREEERAMETLFGLLRRTCDIDFASYKRGTLLRRVGRRMALRRAESLPAYVAAAADDESELQALGRDLLISVTGFFRDPVTFDALTEVVLPRMFTGRAPGAPVRIWVPGCASGEEVYSIAICLSEYLGDDAARAAIQIFGTDLSESALALARAGVYSASIAGNVTPARLAKYFTPADGQWQIAQSLREWCVFARHNVARDPPFSRMDLVSCRNVLIYMDPVLQRRVIPSFHFALLDNGVLMLGPSESIGAFTELFGTLEHKGVKIYTRKHHPLQALHPALAGAECALPHTAAALLRARPADGPRVKQQADRIAATRYAPAAVVCDEDLNVVEFRGDTDPYLMCPPGPPNLSLKALARPGLLVDLSATVRAAGQSGVPATGRAEFVAGPQGCRAVGLQVVPLERGSAGSGFMIFFEPAAGPAPAMLTRIATACRAAAARLWRSTARTPGGQETDAQRLRRTLEATQAHLRSLLEEHEVTVEELKSSQEELLSSNEEFQSTNEELETAREEVHSANEELVGANEELRSRNAQLAELNDRLRTMRDYADAIVQTVRVPLLVLDERLRVVRANASFHRFFQTTDREVEQCPVHALGNGAWDLPALRTLLDEVARGDGPPDDVEITHDFPNIGRRTLSLSASHLQWPGHPMVLLALEDITVRHEALAQLRLADRRKDEFLAMLAHELRAPLAPMRNAVEMLQLGPDPAGAAMALAVLDRQLQKSTRIVDDLLETARVISRRITLRKQRLDFGRLVRQAADAAAPQFAARQHELVVEVAEPGLEVEADPERLDQVVSNLLANAAKYTPAGGCVTVTLSRDGGEAVLRIVDNGIGISGELLPAVFDLFVQEERSLDRSEGGLGIGLSVVRSIVALHGGSVLARSAGRNQGSEFIVRLPLCAPASEAAPAQAPAAQHRAVEPRRILVVDDNVDTAAICAALLQQEGHDTRLAHDADTALATAHEFHPEIVLLDIGLPGMDGYDVARRLREDISTQDAKLVALTGYGGDRASAQAAAAGFDLHLVKPTPMAQLREVIAAYRPATA